MTRLEAKLAEYVFCRRTKDAGLAGELLDQASEYVGRLVQHHPQYLLGNSKVLYFYAMRYEVSGEESDLNAMEQVMSTSIAHKHTGFIVDAYASTMLRVGRNQEALKQLARISNQRDPFVRFARVLLLMETEKGRQEAEKILEASRDDLSSTLAIPALLLLGKKTDAIRRAQKYLESVEQSARGFEYDAAQFQADSIGEEEFLERAGTSQTKQSVAYFSLGVRKLADSDRDGALESFERAADTIYQGTTSAWAGALAARMEEDPTWPDWLTATPVDSEAK